MADQNIANISHWRNDTDKIKLKYSEKILFQCRFVHRRYHTDWLWVNSGLRTDRSATTSGDWALSGVQEISGFSWGPKVCWLSSPELAAGPYNMPFDSDSHPHNMFKSNFNIFLQLCFQTDLLLSVSSIKVSYAYLNSPCVLCPPHLVHLDCFHPHI